MTTPLDRRGLPTCAWCGRLPTFVVSSIRRGKPHGGHKACGVHLHRAVVYVTVPGSEAHVQRLP